MCLGSARADEADVTYKLLGFDALESWAADDHSAALTAFRETCKDLKAPDWQGLCKLSNTLAPGRKNARLFFELFFRPVEISDGKEALFTGYFEPELNGSLRKTDRFKYPVYKLPRAAKNKPWLTRRQILEGRALAGKGLEIAYVDDPVELFFLQIQGSGRIKLQDGKTIRVGYAGFNGHEYKSIGQELVRRGIYEPHQVSAQVIKNWVKRNPVAGRELLYHNPSYVFFREVSHVPAHKGPLGAMNRSITKLRTVAVDPKFVTLGAPVWIEKEGEIPMHRLMIAQDTGSAIKGAQRADIFIGTGDRAGRMAGKLKDPGRMIVLLPVDRAYMVSTDHGL